MDELDKKYYNMPKKQRAEPGELEVGDFVRWNSSGGTAEGRIDEIATSGSINVPDSSFTIDASEDDPAALITVFQQQEDGNYMASDTQVGHRFNTLTKIDPLPMAEVESKSHSKDTALLLKIRERQLELERLNNSNH